MPRSPDTAALADENHDRLEPDRNALEICADAIFRHVLNYQQGFIAVRSFYENDDTDEVFRSSPTSLKGGFQFLIDVAVDDAYRAAQNPRPVVFCPPLAVFGSKDRAREADVIAGLVISVECDQRPQQARAELEAILGPATVVVRSGGVWTNDDGQVEDKLHLHWRLRQPATDEESLAKLKRARQLAAKFVGGDGTGTPINHPYRWPGGWHRKGEPRLVEIDTCNPDAEVDLDTALAALAAVAGHEGSPSLIVSDDDRRRNYAGGWIGTKLYRHEAELVDAANCPIANDDEEIPLVRAPLTESAIAMVRAMVRAIPNDYGFDQPTRPWFIKIGYAIKFALGGDPVGEDIYDEFAQRSPKYNVDDDTRKAYRGFDPDGRVDLNYLHYLANQANPFWDAELYKVQASSRDRTGDKAKSEGDDRQKEDDAGSKDEAKSSAASDKPNTNKTSSPSWSAALPLIDISKWDDEQPPPQEWVVQDRIPVDSVCLFSGEGAAGKSLLQLQLSIATALNRDWLGMVPSQGPALFIDAEDDQTVLHRRAADILKFYSARFADVKDKLHLVSLSEHGAALAYFVRRLGWIEPTSLYRHLLEMVGDLKPKIIGIASSANVFAGSEIDRAQVTQFIALLNRLARRCHGAVVLILHPSLTGISTETGLSGSTQWHNAVRARFYLKAVKPIEGEQPDSNLRELVFLKNNYGSIAGSVALQYQDGLFVPIEGSNLDAKARIEIAKQVFLVLLQRFNRENRNVSATPGRGYGPSLFEPEQEARAARLTKQDLAEAMRQLIREAKIANEEYGKPSNRHHRLVVKFTRDEDAPF